ncbi:peptidase M43- pregnancy-associated plasma-A [Apiospora kogelbergensis]|uniref:peptidase M43- pregnancy-associated plasma-A n=1 Tax=Apiospora kogelbergensis TaxID=1337665 RepID=UPI00312D5D01
MDPTAARREGARILGEVEEESLEQIRASLAAAREYMLYAPHASRNRAWWGSVVVGGTSGGFGGPGVDGRGERLVADVITSWRGWLHVQRQEVPGFGVGMSVDEALGERERRAELVSR